MSLAVCLLAYSVVVMLLGPSLLSRAGELARTAPRLGMAAWIAAMVSGLGSAGAGIAVLGGELVRAWGHLAGVLGGCVALLGMLARGGHGALVQVGMGVAVATIAVGAAIAGARVASALNRARTDTRRHADAAVLAARGSPRGPGGALVLDVSHRSVYCLPGRTRTVVITQGALDVLDEPQLAAVLAHERAHLRGRHHQLLALTAAWARVLPGSRLFSQGAAEVARLAELCADDAAARRHGRETVADALLTLCAPAPGAASPHPVPALGATGSGVAERVERLLFPAARAQARRARTAAAGILVLGPLTIAVLVVARSPVCAPPML